MKIIITYETESSYGLPMRRMYIAQSFAEADSVCDRIDMAGYRLIDVTRDVYED